MVRIRIFTSLAVLMIGACIYLPASAQQNAQSGIDAMKTMPVDADPSFEVATVKRTDPNDKNAGFHLQGQHIWIENETLDKILTFAYDLHTGQIVGGPSWFATDDFDIQGIPDVEGQPDVKQLQSMIRKLLANRFQFKCHHAQQVISVYAIKVAKGGTKLTQSTEGPNALQSENHQRSMGQVVMKVKNMTMPAFATDMDFFMDRPVIDQTGLTGKWDFQWRWTSDETRPSTDANAAPGLFTAIQEQLGLKIEVVKAPVNVLVVDFVERPSAN